MSVQGRIAPSQYVWMVMGFVMGSATLIFVGGQAEKDAWVAILGGFTEALILTLSFLLLSARFPGKGLSGINDTVWGKYAGKIFTLAFIWYTLSLCSIVMTNNHSFVQMTLLNGIPDYPLDLTGFIFLAIAVLYGIENIGRFTLLIAPTLLILAVSITILSIPYMDINNLRPVIATPVGKLIGASHSLATFPFGETVAFAAIIPCLRNPGKALTYTYLGMVIATLVLLMVTIRNISVLGSAVPDFSYTSFTEARVINVSGFFTRMETLIALNYVMSCLIKEMILLYAASVVAADMLNLKSMRTVVIPFAFLAAIFRHHNFPSSIHNFVYAQKIYPIYSLPFELIIPLVTLLVAIILKRKGQTTE